TSRGRPCTSILGTTRWGCEAEREDGQPDLPLANLDETVDVERDDVPATAPSEGKQDRAVADCQRVHPSSVDGERQNWIQRRGRAEVDTQSRRAIDPKRRVRLAHRPAAARVAVPALAEHRRARGRCAERERARSRSSTYERPDWAVDTPQLPTVHDESPPCEVRAV